MLAAVYGWSFFVIWRKASSPPRRFSDFVGASSRSRGHLLANKAGNPRQMVIKARVVDAVTGGPSTLGQSRLRYLVLRIHGAASSALIGVGSEPESPALARSIGSRDSGGTAEPINHVKSTRPGSNQWPVELSEEEKVRNRRARRRIWIATPVSGHHRCVARDTLAPERQQSDSR